MRFAAAIGMRSARRTMNWAACCACRRQSNHHCDTHFGEHVNIHEYQAKEILRGYGVPIPPGDVATTPAEAEQIARRIGRTVVVKAQVHAGGRGKAGGVKLAKTPEEARDVAGKNLRVENKGVPGGKGVVTHAA